VSIVTIKKKSGALTGKEWYNLIKCDNPGGLVLMRRILLIFAAAVLAAGCNSTAEYEAERRHEAFSVPKYQLKGPNLDTAGDYLREASQYYFSAIAATDPLQKKRLLLQAAQSYKKAIAELETVRRHTEDRRRREDLSLVIQHVRQDLNDALRQVPVTGE
jgi:hypothetical protein